MERTNKLIDPYALTIHLGKENAKHPLQYDDVLAVIADEKRVEAVEVVHARRIKDGDVVVCSNCGEEHNWDEYRATYCEDCGAKMDGGNKDA